MFGIGMTELIVILVIALLVIGPEKLPELARMLGKGVAEFKKTAEEFRNSMHEDLKAEEEKTKLLKKSEQNKENIPQGKNPAQEENGQMAKIDENKGPIADEAPPLDSAHDDQSSNKSSNKNSS